MPDKRYKILFGLAALVIILDQGSKFMIMSMLPEHRTVSVIPGFFDLINIRNRGAAFGFLNRSDIEWQFWLFLAATIVASVAIISLIRSSKYNAALALGLGGVLGGALGNLIDRVRFRAVVDFLDIYVGQWHWPAFNVADIAICLGALLSCFVLWRMDDSEKKVENYKKIKD